MLSPVIIVGVKRSNDVISYHDARVCMRASVGRNSGPEEVGSVTRCGENAGRDGVVRIQSLFYCIENDVSFAVNSHGWRWRELCHKIYFCACIRQRMLLFSIYISIALNIEERFVLNPNETKPFLPTYKNKNVKINDAVFGLSIV